jgi:rSAM/selenodomain-associated transferase 1
VGLHLALGRGVMAMSVNNDEPITIAVLAHAPIPGTVKTRLVFRLGVDAATRLQERFTMRTVEIAVAADVGPVKLWCAPDERHPTFGALAALFPITLLRQPEGDLGIRMHAAFRQAARPALVIGTDCPALTVTHLRDAATALRAGSDAVVCPADGGGYVLMGLREPQLDLFKGMRWGSETVMIETRRRLTQAGLTWREPAHLWDVERPSDLRRLRNEGFGDLLDGIDRERAPILRAEAAATPPDAPVPPAEDSERQP